MPLGLKRQIDHVLVVHVFVGHALAGAVDEAQAKVFDTFGRFFQYGVEGTPVVFYQFGEKRVGAAYVHVRLFC